MAVEIQHIVVCQLVVSRNLFRTGFEFSDTVVIHHLVAAGTIDEDIMAALDSKDRTQAAMMNAVKARIN